MADEKKAEEEAGGVATEEAAEHDHDHGDDAFEFVEDPTFDIDYRGDCQYEVKVSIPAANEKKQAGEMFEELKSETELPGFRRGRAPLKLIERKFSKAVKNDVSVKLVGAAFEKLVKDEDLKPAGYPDIDGLDDDKERPEGEPLEFTLKFDVAPRVELGEYRGIEVERPVVKVDKRDVDEAVEDIRNRHAVYEELEGGVAAEGDQVIIDFKGTVGGEEFSGGSAENYPYILGSKRFFPEFEKALLGSSPGDDLRCKVTFPDGYFAEELRGKQGDFTIKVNEVKRKKAPKLVKAFAVELGYEDVRDMKAKVKERIGEATSAQSQDLAEARAIAALIESSTFEIAPGLVDIVSRRHQEQAVRELIAQGLPREAFEARVQAVEQESRETALGSIKTMVMLNEIGEAEGIEVTEEDLDKEAETISSSIGAELDEVAEYIKHDEQRSTFLSRIYRTKALAVIMDNARITDTELTREAFDEEEGAESESEE